MYLVRNVTSVSLFCRLPASSSLLGGSQAFYAIRKTFGPSAKTVFTSSSFVNRRPPRAPFGGSVTWKSEGASSGLHAGWSRTGRAFSCKTKATSSNFPPYFVRMAGLKSLRNMSKYSLWDSWPWRVPIFITCFCRRVFRSLSCLS
jgi:hypothetical protein